MSRAALTLTRLHSPSSALKSLTFVTCLLLEGPAWGQPLACAQPLEVSIAQAQATAPGRLTIERRGGVFAQAILAKFNAEPPPSEVVADEVVLAILPGASRTFIIFGMRGGYLESYFIDAGWGRALLGEGA